MRLPKCGTGVILGAALLVFPVTKTWSDTTGVALDQLLSDIQRC